MVARGEWEVNRKNNVLVLRNRVRKIYGSYMLTIVRKKKTVTENR